METICASCFTYPVSAISTLMANFLIMIVLLQSLKYKCSTYICCFLIQQSFITYTSKLFVTKFLSGVVILDTAPAMHSQLGLDSLHWQLLCIRLDSFLEFHWEFTRQTSFCLSMWNSNRWHTLAATANLVTLRSRQITQVNSHTDNLLKPLWWVMANGQPTASNASRNA